jgi:molybdopterin-guanine dinucleotide biosynthesis protein A
MKEKSVKCLILIGGQSTRMGSDKAFVQWQGQTLLEKAIDHLSEITEDIYLSVNVEQYDRLHGGYNCIQDRYPDKGPLGGILSALEILQEDLIVLAVDMPNLSATSVKDLISAAKDSNRITCYQYNEAIQPFPSYWPVQVLPKLEQSVLNNRLAMIKFIIEQQPNLISANDNELFKNFNRPDDMIE